MLFNLSYRHHNANHAICWNKQESKKKEVCPKYDENGKLKQEMVLVEYVYLLSSYRTYALTLPRNVIRMCM